ncbi:MAG: acetyl-CoA carboxylase biotin carboxyl carrier protein subunit [Candidatus Marinimicrobia bacterium CG08_land_8_20_14_0_20_45_22]|nr:MAG: acetyl-CoA carboxylase biotin carboxyl carrier protein subunit [Candidatus Marinimicrobia bacterium CG08_land_8_20_14_0_20_45_22]
MKEKKLQLEINGKEYEVVISEFNAYEAVLTVNGKKYQVGLKDIGIEQVSDIKPKLNRSEMIGETEAAQKTVGGAPEPTLHKPKSIVDATSVLAPLPGLIQKIHVKEGDNIRAGQCVIIMEAMKMENEIQSSKDGIVKEIFVKAGDSVNEGDVLIILG